jgi:hypothetical protein
LAAYAGLEAEAGWLAGWLDAAPAPAPRKPLPLQPHQAAARLHCISSFLLALCRVTFSQDRIAPKKMRPFFFTRRLVNLCFFFSFFWRHAITD